MSEKELKCINSLLASAGLASIVEHINNKYYCTIVQNNIFCCGLVTSDLMQVRKYLINKINKLCLIK